MTSRQLISVAGLAALALVAAASLTLAWRSTADDIAINERNFRLRALNEIVPPARYDNDLFDDTTTALDPELLGTGEPVTVYRARRDGQPVAVIFRVVAPRGYSGAIELLVGINFDGSVAGVRVSEHRETAGLGDQIEGGESDWIFGFTGRSLANPPEPGWAVQKDGGVFDQFTGATITPRAVVKAVRNALLYFSANRDELFAQDSPAAS